MQKSPGLDGSVVPASSAEMPAEEPSGRAIAAQVAFVSIWPPALPVAGSAASQLYSSVAAFGWALS